MAGPWNKGIRAGEQGIFIFEIVFSDLFPRYLLPFSSFLVN